MQWGAPEILKLLERRARRGKRVQALEDRPEVYTDLLPVWDGFCALHSARGNSLGVEALRVQDIVGWLDLYGISGDERVERFELIRVLDDAWIEHVCAEAKMKTKTKEKEKADADHTGGNRRKRGR